MQPLLSNWEDGNSFESLGRGSTEPLLQDKPTPRDLTAVRAWLVLINVVIGMGLLSIPYCFRTGIVTNILLLVFIGIASYASFILLVDSAMTAGTSIDYGQLMSASVGPSFEWIANVVILIVFFGVAALHLQFSYSLATSILDELKSVPHWLYNRWLWIIGIALVIDLPLTFIRSLAKYSHVSLAVFFLIVLYLVHAAFFLGKTLANGHFDPDHSIRYFSFGKDLIGAYSIQAFAFNCHPNVGPTILRLSQPTRTRQYWVLAAVILGAGCCYLLGGIMPYLTLTDKVTGPVIFSDYPPGQPLTIVTKAFYGLFLIVATPLILYSARLCFVALIWKHELGFWKWNGIGVAILMLVAVVAAAVKSISVMFDFLGGVAVSWILYILPAIYYLRLCKGESTWKRWMAWAMIPLGIATIGVCLYHSIDQLIHPDN
jgi:amino acid permease